MNATTAITVGISIAGFIIGIIIKVAGLSTKFGQMTQQLESNEMRDVEERSKVREKFVKLYQKTNEHETKLSSIGVQMDIIKRNIEDERVEIREKLNGLSEKTSKHDMLLSSLVEKIDGIKEDTREIKDALQKSNGGAK